MEPKELSIELIKEITDGFSVQIGEGSFGVVYKGKLKGQEVAVKKLLDSSTVNEREFHQEVTILSVVNHQNIVKLIGYCCHKKDTVELRQSFCSGDVVEKYLCFEYVPNGSLDKHIYGGTSEFGWDKRFKIIKGICTGLQVLHEQRTPIIHSDLNPGNILLDIGMEPKISDFGLSRLFGENQTHTRILKSNSAIGFMAPEYLQRGLLSIQSDIYSLGLLIIEITTGEKSSSDDEMFETDIMDNVRKNWTTVPYIKSNYPALRADGHRQVKGCIELGLSCIEKKRMDRPTSASLVKKLEQIWKQAGTNMEASSSSVLGKVNPFGLGAHLGASSCAGWVRTGFVTASGERVVSGLVQRLDSLDFVSDNTGSFTNDTTFPRNGGMMLFGMHRFYVGTGM
ncbi:hypothetical protein QYE76_003273 [Lolium multiflorum]|uniref:Protein kinase domain-containing protein n=1 Tax=Lolium multiflorum TaxID=4521 RepID=A0AAD8RPU4_LOLMU|nr:hypothetical protein QYE76_003273 [Lolium multiflorum]